MNEFNSVVVVEEDLDFISGTRGKRFGIRSNNSKQNLIELYQKKGSIWVFAFAFPYIWISDLVNILCVAQLGNKGKNQMEIITKDGVLTWLRENKKDLTKEEVESILNSNPKEIEHPSNEKKIKVVKKNLKTQFGEFWIADRGNGLQVGLGSAKQEVTLIGEEEDKARITISGEKRIKKRLVGFNYVLQEFDPDIFADKQEAQKSYYQIKRVLESSCLTFYENTISNNEIPFKMGANNLQNLPEIIFGESVDVQLNVPIIHTNYSVKQNEIPPYVKFDKKIQYIWAGEIFITVEETEYMGDLLK